MNRKKTVSFLKGFVAVILVMVLVLIYVALRRAGGAQPETTQPSAVTATDAYGSVVATSEPMVLQGNCDFLIGCGEGGRVDFLLRAVFDLDAKRVTVFAIPVDLPLRRNGKSASAGEILADGGVSALVSAIGGYYGDSFDRYYFCTPEGFISASNRLGSVQLEIKKDVSYIREDIVLNLTAGKHSISGEDLYNYLTYADKGDSLLTLQAQAGAAMLRDYLKPKNTEKGEDLFSALINVADSNITAYDYARYGSVLQAIAESAQIDYTSGGIAAYPGGDGQ